MIVGFRLVAKIEDAIFFSLFLEVIRGKPRWETYLV